MENFEYYNPVRIVFGKGTIGRLESLIPAGQKILLAYGGGSIKKNGVYNQIVEVLKGRAIVEFPGIEPNPRYETLMKAARICQEQKIDFILAVGGGSVLDGVKFIALAACYDKGDPWDILTKNAPVTKALPLGCVLTLPATGSEMNMFSVVSRDSTNEKLAFANPLVFPKFSILDPETTYSLPERQVSNGITDAFAHVMEQYMTFPSNNPLQDRQAEAILMTLIEEGPKVLKNLKDYEARANLVWSATQALNGIISCGVREDWATHMIGHEITALYGLDHAQTLAVVMLGVWKHQKTAKAEKLAQYARRVWGMQNGCDLVDQAISKTESFFRSVGMKTRLDEYGIKSDRFEELAARFEKRGIKLGERQAIGKKEVIEILNLCHPA